ncbi:NAD(P)H-quinone oxidoreductase subunit 3 [Mucilaginibacter gotjawali]|nr:NAD(P)H-quinone oxidoreductase subunit 3 [Mucilaginibacter gotjawali]
MVGFTFFITRLIAPNKPNAEKLTSYECGEEPTGNAWLPFNTRFYVIALVFLLFDVEMVFIFPWAIVFGSHAMNEMDPRWSVLSLIEMFVFLGILILGLAYVWAKGDLNWIKPDPIRPVSGTNIPTSLYDKLNEEQSAYQVKAFTVDLSSTQQEQAAATATATAAPPPIRKPMFKPTFKKPGNE